jgi:uncharacterized protein YggE
MSPATTTRLSIGAAVLAAVAALSTSFLLGRQPTRAYAAPNAPVGAVLPQRDRQITVTGKAEQRIKPDRATLSFSVATRSKTPSAAQLSNEAATAKVIAALKAAGASDGEINPRGLVITTEERSEQDPRVPIEVRTETISVTYTVVTTEVAVATNKLGRVGTMVRGAFDAGATTGSVDFSSSKMRKLADDARAAAMKAAVEKAEAMTKAAGAARGSVINIGLDEWSPLQYRGQGRVELNRQNVAEATASPTPELMNEQFGGGMISVSASVSASFAIVDK